LMTSGKYIDFDIDSSIVEKKVVIVYMQYFHERGESKKMESLYSSDLGLFCRHCLTKKCEQK
jgi:hypothetical protein